MNTSVQEIVTRITAILNNGLAPERIILFGSYARGNPGPGSDIDILLVMPDGTNRRKTAVEGYRLLGAIGIPKDIVVVTEQDIREFGLVNGTILQPALAEGKVLYDKAA